MAGIGVKLQKIFDKKSIAAHLVGFVYSTISTVAPMFVVIGNIMLMSYVLGYDTLSYARLVHVQRNPHQVPHGKLRRRRPGSFRRKPFINAGNGKAPVDGGSVQCGTVALYVGCDL